MSRFIVLLLLVVPAAVTAQGPRSSVLLDHGFASWEQPSASIRPGAVQVPAASPHRVRNALIGGVVGAAAGVAACTVFSNIADDAAADRFTTCTAKGYLLTGGIGFGAGFLVGWLVSS
jgi:hypothetical protein